MIDQEAAARAEHLASAIDRIAEAGGRRFHVAHTHDHGVVFYSAIVEYRGAELVVRRYRRPDAAVRDLAELVTSPTCPTCGRRRWWSHGPLRDLLRRIPAGACVWAITGSHWTSACE